MDRLVQQHIRTVVGSDLAILDWDVSKATGRSGRGPLGPYLKRRMFKRGELIISAGSPASDVLSINKGYVSIVIPDKAAGIGASCSFDGGTTFAVTEALSNGKYLYDLYALSACWVTFISREGLDLMLTRLPVPRRKLIRSLSELMQQRFRNSKT